MLIALITLLMQKALAFVGALCIIRSMRQHSQIIREAGKAELVAEKRGVSINTVRSWIQRDSIPADHWVGFVADKFATLEELAAARSQAA